jgi:hypothetical protein
MPTLLEGSDSDSDTEEALERTTPHPAEGTVEEDVKDELPGETRMRFTTMLSHDEPQQEPAPEELKPDPAQPDPGKYLFGVVLKSTRGAVKFIEYLVDGGRLTAEESDEHRARYMDLFRRSNIDEILHPVPTTRSSKDS